MTIDSDLAKIAQQEELLAFEHFSVEDAWALGCDLREAAMARAAPVAIDITLATRQVFFVALPASSPDNAEWIRRKRNCVLRFFRSSYRVKLELDKTGLDIATRHGVDPRDFAASGGSFPISLRRTGIIGAVTVSGLPQREDHALIVSVVAARLGQDAKALALD